MFSWCTMKLQAHLAFSKQFYLVPEIIITGLKILYFPGFMILIQVHLRSMCVRKDHSEETTVLIIFSFPFP